MNRYLLLDLWRGIAFFLMVIYHACYDLNLYGLLRTSPDFSFGFQLFRTLILSMFLSATGAALVFAQQKGLHLKVYVKRLTLLLICMVLVSAGSYVIFPDAWIFLGVLHFIFLASILALPFVNHPWISLIAAALVFLISFSFDYSLWGFFVTIGLPPTTVDYVPLFPWLGVVFLGIALAHTRFFTLLNHSRYDHLRSWRIVKGFEWVGGHCLILYLIHQPLLLAMLYPLQWLK